MFGAETNEIQSVSVIEGNSFTLHTDVTKIHKNDDILWNFGAEKSIIAQINREVEQNVFKMAPRMAAVLRAPRKLCRFSYVLFVFFVVLRVRCC